MSADPLSTLRRCIIEGKYQSHDPTTNTLHLDAETFSATVPTRWKTKTEFYTIGSLWFFYITTANGTAHHQYVQKKIISIISLRPDRVVFASHVSPCAYFQ